MTIRRLVAALLILLLVGTAAFWWLAHRSEIAPAEPPSRETIDPSRIEKGAGLALIGNCITCHTAEGGQPYAGGRALQTPFGVLYGTNITPDPETGIGRWSQAAFVRSMREGVDRAGRHLYPAFPYDHFRRVSDEDLEALYAYLITREPVRKEAPEPDLAFPMNFRPLIAGWKLLFLGREPDPQSDRGAYLVHGLAHCGSCHTPRNFLGAEKERQAFAGGEASGWHGPALNADPPAPRPWNAERLFAYLRHGIDDLHSVPAGPMSPVVSNLALAPEADVQAIARYVASLMPGEESASAGASTSQATRTASPGGQIYAGACASCHDAGRAAPGGALHLALSTEVALATPRNLIRVIRDGIVPPEGKSGPWMPAFAGALTDAQLVELVRYLRQEFGKKAAWDDVEDEVRNISRGEP